MEKGVRGMDGEGGERDVDTKMGEVDGWGD